MPSIGSFLQPVLNQGIQMKDYAHASRLYADNVFALAPKAGWLYYVEFDIEPSAITDQSWANKQKVTEVGLLVKSCDLPKFTVQTETVNQYNRKTVVQKAITYNPVNILMHDDQSNVVHNLWVNYYRYYYADSTWGGTGPIGTARDNTPGAYQNNKYLPPNDLFNPVNYGLNSRLVVSPFFRSITIYQLNRKVFTSYKLVNPMISSWEHDRLDQTSGNKLAESKMNVAYEAVFYGTGKVKRDNPTGFAVFHYDTSPSPLSLLGGGNNSIFGPGGVVPGALEIFGDVSGILNPDNNVSPLGAIGTVIKGVNLARNVKGITKESLRAEGYKIVSGALRNVARGSLNGLGTNLNLQKGNNFATAGQFLGTPVAVVTAAAIGQEFGPGGTTSQTVPAARTPTSSNADSAASNAQGTSNEERQRIAESEISRTTDDNLPSGSTPSAGRYFDPVETPLDTATFERPDIDEFSPVEDIDGAIDELNSAWAQDNEFIAGQAPNEDEVSRRLNEAADYEEYASIKADADAAYQSRSSAQSIVDAKYQAELSRLRSLRQLVATESTGPSTLGFGDEDNNPGPAPESTSIPDIEF